MPHHQKATAHGKKKNRADGCVSLKVRTDTSVCKYPQALSVQIR